MGWCNCSSACRPRTLLAAYPNAGYPRYHEGRFLYHTAPDYFAQAAREMVAQGARLIGGCCGTNPTHIKAIASAIAELQPVKSKTVRVTVEPLPLRNRAHESAAEGVRSIASRKRSVSLYVSWIRRRRWRWRSSSPVRKR